MKDFVVNSSHVELACLIDSRLALLPYWSLMDLNDKEVIAVAARSCGDSRFEYFRTHDIEVLGRGFFFKSEFGA